MIGKSLGNLVIQHQLTAMLKPRVRVRASVHGGLIRESWGQAPSWVQCATARNCNRLRGREHPHNHLPAPELIISDVHGGAHESEPRAARPRPDVTLDTAAYLFNMLVPQ